MVKGDAKGPPDSAGPAVDVVREALLPGPGELGQVADQVSLGPHDGPHRITLEEVSRDQPFKILQSEQRRAAGRAVAPVDLLEAVHRRTSLLERCRHCASLSAASAPMPASSQARPQRRHRRLGRSGTSPLARRRGRPRADCGPTSARSLITSIWLAAAGFDLGQFYSERYRRFRSLRTPVPLARPPDYDQSSARRDHQASAAVIAPSASRMPSPTSPAVAAQCRGTRARAPGSHRYSSRVNGSGAVLS